MSEQESLIVVYKTRKAFIIEYCCIVILTGILVVSYFLSGSLIETFRIPGLLLILVIIAYVELSRLAHRCKVNASKIVLINGLIKQSKNHIYLSAITDVDSHQNYWQRGLNFGTILFKSASGQSTLELEDINNPEEFIREIETIIEKYKNPNSKD